MKTKLHIGYLRSMYFCAKHDPDVTGAIVERLITEIDRMNGGGIIVEGEIPESPLVISDDPDIAWSYVHRLFEDGFSMTLNFARQYIDEGRIKDACVRLRIVKEYADAVIRTIEKHMVEKNERVSREEKGTSCTPEEG